MVRMISLYTLVNFAQYIETKKSHLQWFILICAEVILEASYRWKYKDFMKLSVPGAFSIDFYTLFSSSFYQKDFIVKVWKKRSPGKLRFPLVFLSLFHNQNIFSALILNCVFLWELHWSHLWYRKDQRFDHSLCHQRLTHRHKNS